MSERSPSRCRRIRSAWSLLTYVTASTCWRSRIMFPSSRSSALVASGAMKTSSSILLRTSFDLAVAARTTGMKTPSTSVVINTVANAARLGAALRRSARRDSLKKKPSLIEPSVVLAAALVAHDPALAQLDHTAPHLVDHVGVVGRDDHRRAGAVHAVEQLHDALGGVGVEVAGRLVGEQQ